MPTDPPGDPDPIGLSAALARTHDWFEWNSGWAPPDPDTLAEWLADGVCRCPDNCLVAPSEWCEHGLASWHLVLRHVDRPHRGVDRSRGPGLRSGRPGRIGRVTSPSDDPVDPLDHLDVDGIITDLEAEFQDQLPESGPLPVDAADHPHAGAPGLPPLPEVLPPLAGHLGQHDIPIPHELSPVERFDQAVDKAFDRLRGTEPADRIFYAITELADFSLLWLLIAASRAAANEKQLPMAVRVGVLLPIESVVVNAGIKSAFKRERPVRQTERPYKLRVPLTTSFPSGHSSAAMMAAILLSENSRVKPLYWGLAGLVASSRVYVQIHHASDVVGGLAVGVVLGNVAKRAWPLDRGPIGVRRLRRR